MEATDNAFSKLVKLVKSWFPWRAEPENVSKDFWMPDHSCRVCYECDSEFSIVNRRHHCRLCGRVFCAKCTTNSIPFPYDVLRKRRDDDERNRVCNYCFKQWEQDTAAEEYVCRAPTLYLSPSCSGMSMVSSQSSGAANSDSNTAGSMSFSCSSGVNPCRRFQAEPRSDKQGRLKQDRVTDAFMNVSCPSDGFRYASLSYHHYLMFERRNASKQRKQQAWPF